MYRKNRLPNYGVFDEVRYFEPGSEAALATVDGVAVGLTICEDLWQPGAPASLEAERGARLILNPSGSPYLRGKGHDRELMFAERARAYGVPIAFCNLVGGQDELVFDGHSFVVGADGGAARPSPPVRARSLAVGGRRREGRRGSSRMLADLDEVYAALTVGLRDYVGKNGFQWVIVGLSGGIDSALVAVLAADALGSRPAHLRGDAVSPFERCDPGGRPDDRLETSEPSWSSWRSSRR